MKRIAWFLLALLLLCSCASPKPERVTEAELAALRAQYPYNNTPPSIADMASYRDTYPTLEKLLELNNADGPTFCAVAVLKMKGDWYEISTDFPEYPDWTDTLFPSNRNITWTVRDAKVQQILWGGKDLKKGDTITLGFGSSIMTFGAELELVYRTGEELVCFLFDARNLEFVGGENLYSTSKAHTFFLSKEDVVLSVSDAKGPDSVSGMYLHAFAQNLTTYLGSPNAKPEEQTE